MTELIARTLATPDLLTFALVPRGRRAGRHRVVHADRPGHRPGRGGRRALRAVAAAHPRRDRGDPPADALRLRGPRLPPVRVEVRLAQRAVPARGRPARLHLRGPVPAPHGDQGPQPRHRLVLGHRRRVARRTRGARARGSTRPTSTRTAGSGRRCRRCGRRHGVPRRHDRRRRNDHALPERHRAGRARGLAGALRRAARPVPHRRLRDRPQAWSRRSARPPTRPTTTPTSTSPTGRSTCGCRATTPAASPSATSTSPARSAASPPTSAPSPLPGSCRSSRSRWTPRRTTT